MKMEVYAEDLSSIFKELNVIDNTPQEDAGSRTYLFPSKLGTGQIRHVHLRHGMGLYLTDAALRETIIMDVDVQYPHLEVSYTLSGQGCWEAAKQNREFNMSPGNSTLIFMRETGLHAELFKGEPIEHVELRIDLRTAQALLPEHPALLQKQFICRQSIDAPQVQLLVEQIKNCPYSGALERLYLEGKAFEWIALQWQGIDEVETRLQRAARLTRGDMQCLEQAKQVLSHTWDNPPTLIELSRRIGLNDYKLKAGFKQVFGTTVFGYVRALRMKEAHRLLEQGAANVSEASGLVGYQNVSHFAALFRKTYGYNPSELGKRLT
ncbi:AraC family transcriptional regulator [Paenibacillaceae bacterium]|nr:AraC family transcriptional regulator [Paenibacillaceae bacterium]